MSGKGSHLIVDPFPGAPRDVVYYESKTDGRLGLGIPWMGRYMNAVKQHWHERFHHDPGNRWLRGVISELLSDAGSA